MEVPQETTSILTPEATVLDLQLARLPLSGITGKYGEHGLIRRLEIDTTEFLDEDESEMLRAAIALAQELHADDKHRGIAYTTHVLRVAIRLQRDFRVRDPDMLVAAILHDSGEDHPKDLMQYARRHYPEARILTFEDALEALFNPRVSTLVASVSNLPTPPGMSRAEKHRLYQENVAAKIAHSYDTFLLKLSDFIDNGVGLHWGEDAQKLLSVSQKYLPVFDTFITQAGHYLTSGEMTLQQHQLAIRKLIKGKEMARQFLATAS